jgi:hypothetical protein
MKRLTTYTKNGYVFSVIKREVNKAIFRGVSRNGTANFEVIIVQSHDGREAFGKVFEPAEYAPSNKQWGVKGWTYSNMDDAERKFDEL